MSLTPRLFVFLSLALLSTALSQAAVPAGPGDWPQWRGPKADGVSRETGLLKDWSTSGPPVAWQVETVGVGYSSLAVKDGVVITQGDLDGIEHIIALSAKDGSIVWKVQPEPVAKALQDKVAAEFKRLDKNGDGQVDEIEGLSNLGDSFNRADKATDKGSEKVVVDRVARLMKGLDKNGDGVLTFSEGGAALRNDFFKIDAEDKQADADALAKRRTTEWLQGLDKDQDGKLTRDEAKGTLVDSRFDNIDRRDPATNKGDKLAASAEIEAYLLKAEKGKDGQVTHAELLDHYAKNLAGRDGILSQVELRGVYGGLRDGMGDGPRGTPTIDGDRVYTEGGLGDVTCLDLKTGKTLWHKNLDKDLGGSRPGWGYSESPLVFDNVVVVTPGGKQGTLVALNKLTGEVAWRSTKIQERAQYSSPVLADVGGVRQIVQFASNRVFGVKADDGEFLWDYNKPSNGTANCTTPIVAQGHVFGTSSYGTGGGLAKIAGLSGGQKAEEVYFDKKMANHHGGVVLIGDHLYGYGNGGLICMEYLTGKIKWTGKGGKGSLVAADGMLYCLDEGQKVSLVEANPQEFVERGSFKIDSFGRPSWAHPVVAGGKLYIRNMQRLAAYEIRAK